MNLYKKIKLVILIVFSICFLAILYKFSENNRYAFIEKGGVIDTRTGDFHIITTGKSFKINETTRKYEEY